ncbi:MAG: glycine cleavage system protein GcvH [Phycisphaerae bacterium]
MRVPEDRRYRETHEWFQVDGDVVTIGITGFAADELTDITFVDLPAVGTRVEAGGEIGEIESVKATSELTSAVGGEIIEINESLSDAPQLVNKEPFGDGWMVKIKAADLAPLEKLMNADAYAALCAKL